MKKLIPFLLIAGALLTGCIPGANLTHVIGSGDIETRSYDDLGEFNEINLSGFGTVYVTQGKTNSVEVETDDNIFRYLEVDVWNNTLELGFKENITTNFDDVKIIYRITTPDLSAMTIGGAGQVNVGDFEIDGNFDLVVTGAGDINFEDLQAENMDVLLKGAGSITIESGAVEYQDVTISGVGEYRATGLSSVDAKVTINGAGEARVWAIETLDAKISGVGSIRYEGDPRINQSISGFGSLSRD